MIDIAGDISQDGLRRLLRGFVNPYSQGESVYFISLKCTVYFFRASLSFSFSFQFSSTTYFKLFSTSLNPFYLGLPFLLSLAISQFISIFIESSSFVLRTYPRYFLLLYVSNYIFSVYLYFF